MAASMIGRRGAKREGRAYAREVREAALREVRSGRARGQSVRSVSRALGISYETLRNWLKAEHAGLRAVQVTRDREESGSQAIVRLPGGVRVEGLGVAEIAALARLLA